MGRRRRGWEEERESYRGGERGGEGRMTGRRVMAPAPSSSTLHNSTISPNTDFTSSLASGTMVFFFFFFFQKLVMKLLSSLLAVQLPSSVLLTGLPNGAGIGDQERDLAKGT